ncbi:MAG: hypothetical protein V7L04_31805 [Nostoc sp.]|uniref:hypothetical protein n=1 Tax=Nostoc sp. TaxID=1180 RepID=UPI002FF79940
MTKRKILSRVVDAKILAIYELDQFIDYIHTVDPELNLNQSIAVAAVALHNLPELFQRNPLLMEHLTETAATIKRQGHRNTQRSTN